MPPSIADHVTSSRASTNCCLIPIPAWSEQREAPRGPFEDLALAVIAAHALPCLEALEVLVVRAYHSEGLIAWVRAPPVVVEDLVNEGSGIRGRLLEGLSRVLERRCPSDFEDLEEAEIEDPHGAAVDVVGLEELEARPEERHLERQ